MPLVKNNVLHFSQKVCRLSDQNGISLCDESILEDFIQKEEDYIILGISPHTGIGWETEAPQVKLQLRALQGRAMAHVEKTCDPQPPLKIAVLKPWPYSRASGLQWACQPLCKKHRLQGVHGTVGSLQGGWAIPASQSWYHSELSGTARAHQTSSPCPPSRAWGQTWTSQQKLPGQGQLSPNSHPRWGSAFPAKRMPHSQLCW